MNWQNLADEDVTFKVSKSWKITYGCMLILSQLSAVIIPYLYLSSKKCRHHPASIILILCIFEMISTYQLYMQSVCLTELLQWTNFESVYRYLTFNHYPQDKSQLDYLMCCLNQSIYVTCISAQLCYYIVLCVDLIVTLKRPFQNSSTRIYTYHFVSLLTTLVSSYYILDEVKVYCKLPQCEGNYAKFEFQTLLILQVTFIVIASASLYSGFANLRLMNQINLQVQETKKKYIVNHMLMIGAIIIIWLPPSVYGLYENYFSEDSIHQSFLLKLCFSILLMNPIIFALIRMREPYFYFRIKFLFLTIFGKVTPDDRKEVQQLESNDDEFVDQWLIPLNKLVQKKQSRETVCHILGSILEIVEYNSNINFDGLSLDELQKQAKQKRTKKILQQNSTHNSFNRNHKYQDNESEDIGIFLMSHENVPTESTSLNYVVVEYAPGIFQYLRELDGITEYEFHQSLDIIKNGKQIDKTQESLGKSGSFFFFSHDQKLILKTLIYSEMQTLVKTLLPQYCQYIQESQTLIAKIYGAFTVDIEGLASIHLVLMENTTSYVPIHGRRMYDLKGSIINRYIDPNDALQDDASQDSSQLRASIIPKQLRKVEDLKSTEVLKDVNFLESSDLFLELDTHLRDEFMNLLKSDSDLLKSRNIMDYSLIICINDIKESSFKASDLKKSFANNQFRRIQTSKKIISLSVIDILQKYDLKKRLEYNYKTFFAKDPQMLSCVDADQYSQRFLAFVNSICISVKRYC